MYSLLDHTAQVFLNPLSFINEGDAIRWFTTVVNNTEEKTNISNHPGQFTLFRLADYDDKTGQYEKDMQPKEIISGMQVQEEATKKFTVSQLVTMIQTELSQRGVIDLQETTAYSNKLSETAHEQTK